MNEKVLYYSLVEKIKKSQLMTGDFDQIETSGLKRRMQTNHVFGVVESGDDYHYKMNNIAASPYIYYGKGDHSILHKPLLSLVGPRKMSDYAHTVLQKLFSELQYYDVATVSGMAPGVDSLCHELSIQYDIPTVAVLGGGLGYFLKSGRRSLIDKIVHHGGLVLSDFKLGQVPTVWSYPQRNRIIAGLGKCLFVPEAQKGSGSLITVDNALSLYKSVYGVPQSIFAINSEGLLEYMESGKVRLVLDLTSFLKNEFGEYLKKGPNNSNRPTINLTSEQQDICDLLQGEKRSVSYLVERLGLAIDALMSDLTILEMMGVIEESVGFYRLTM